MLNDNAKALVTALRSGDYLQAREVLHEKVRNRESFCCLGVGCDLYIKAGSPNGEVATYWGTIHDDMSIMNYRDVSGRYTITSLPEPVRVWLGFQDRNGGFFQEHSVKSSLACLNDKGASFKEIADVIESEPKGLLIPPEPETT